MREYSPKVKKTFQARSSNSAFDNDAIRPYKTLWRILENAQEKIQEDLFERNLKEIPCKKLMPILGRTPRSAIDSPEEYQRCLQPNVMDWNDKIAQGNPGLDE